MNYSDYIFAQGPYYGPIHKTCTVPPEKRRKTKHNPPKGIISDPKVKETNLSHKLK